MHNQDTSNSKQLMNSDNLRELDLKILEICTGASLSSIIPLKILISHLIEIGLIEKRAIIKDFESGLSTQMYGGELRQMLEPIWNSLITEIKNM